MNLKKVLSLIVVLALVTICFPSSVYAEDTNSNSVVLCGQQLLSMRNKYTLTTNSSKKSYLKEICNYFGMNPSTIDYLKDSTIVCLATSQEFGFQTVVSSEQIGQRSIPSAEREYDEMTLSMLWGRTGTTYTIMGFQEWTDLPVLRSKDIISLDLGGGSIVDGSQDAILMYNKNGTSYTDEFDKDDSEYRGIQSACIFEIDLPSSVDDIGFIISYSIVKNSTDNTITMLYFHRWAPWMFSVGISYVGGITLSPTTIYTPYSLQTGTAI